MSDGITDATFLGYDIDSKIMTLWDLQKAQKQDTEEILDILKNNGLCTEQKLTQASLNRLWWWVGAISLAIMAACIFVIRSSMAG